MDENRDISMEQRILEAAERLFVAKGFAATSTTEIANEAGCNQALVHYYYRTKLQLFEKVFESKARLFASIFLSEDKLGGSFEEKLRRKVELHFDVVSANRQLPLFLINELATNPERIESMRQLIGDVPQRVYQVIKNELKEEIRAGRVRPISTLDLMLNVISLNVFHAFTMPIIGTILHLSDKEKTRMDAHRKEVIVETVLDSIRVKK